MSKVFVFIYDGMADFEITFVCHLLGAHCGKRIITIAYDDKPIGSKGGIVYKPEMSVKAALNEDMEALLIPGGRSTDLRQELLELIKKAASNGKLVGAICAGPWFLAKAGILNKAEYTTSIVEWTSSHRDFYKEDDPFPRETFKDERVIIDKNIITAKGNAFIDFSIAICDWFNLFKDKAERDEFSSSIKGF